MIAVDMFRDQGDGYAWLIFDDYEFCHSCQDSGVDRSGSGVCGLCSRPVADWKRLDRPCDTCGGSGSETMDSMLAVGVPGGQYPIGPCPDCIDGRHTFDLEVDRDCDDCDEGVAYGPEWEDWDRRTLMPCETCGGEPRSLRVSVVPEMVLPILGGDLIGVGRPVIHTYPTESYGTRYYLYALNGSDDDHLTLPDDAEPGMWAVLLRTKEQQ